MPRNYVLGPVVPNGLGIKHLNTIDNENPAIKPENPELLGNLESIKESLVVLCSRLNSIEAGQERIRLETNKNFEELNEIIKHANKNSNEHIAKEKSEYLIKMTEFERNLDTIRTQHKENYGYLYSLILQISGNLSNPFYGIPEQNNF